MLVGTIGGAVTGAVIGGLIDRGEGAGKGAIIGGVGGTLLGAGVTSDRYKRAYANAYERCMDNYEGQRVRYRPPKSKMMAAGLLGRRPAPANIALSTRRPANTKRCRGNGNPVACKVSIAMKKAGGISGLFCCVTQLRHLRFDAR